MLYKINDIIIDFRKVLYISNFYYSEGRKCFKIVFNKRCSLEFYSNEVDRDKLIDDWKNNY